MSLAVPSLQSPALALVTTAHIALTVVRHQRQRAGGVRHVTTIAGVALALTPWIWSSWLGAALGLLGQLAISTAAARLRQSGGRAPTSAGPRGFVPTAVLSVMQQTAGIRTFRMMRPHGFDFVAGQFLAIRVRIDGADHIRCYSISSAPESPYLEISVKNQGRVSSALHASLAPGVVAYIKPPAGAFVYPAAEDRPLLLVAGGVGITPMLSMMRHAAARDRERRLTLFYSAAAEADLAFRAEIETLASAHPRITAVLAATRTAPTSGAVHHGRVDAALIRAAMPDAASAIAMLCGPQPMIDAMRETLVGIGLAPDRVRSEVFEAVAAVTRGRTSRADGAAAISTVRCTVSDTTLRVPAGETLLDAAEAAGLAIDSLCRSGVCGTCRTRVLEGDVECQSSMLDASERGQGFVLACVSHVLSDCVIEA